ncbi:MAG TPA: GGDEF domain-containing protein [Vicinamibacteria bacterium]|nr:GGDEF domain-containing protein [Vicinamibacteria bacterium]
MNPDPSPSLEALLLQAIGVVPLAALSALLSHSIRRDYLGSFWRAWWSLAIALFSLYFSRRLPGARPALEALYFLGEYVFAGFILAGCRNLATGARASRRWLWLLLPLAALAAALAHLHDELAVRFIPHAAIMAVLFALALHAVRHVPPARRGRIGTPLLQLSLLALVALFAHYVPVLAWAQWTGATLPGAYARYASLLDLLLETLLGFGTLIVVLEREHRELELANDQLRAAQEKLETMARVDPLTASLNRHAFYSMIEGHRATGEASGCVAVVDLDALKRINDTLGHGAGDAAIRAAARAIRQVVRADDLVFRWGGDEFLVVLFGVSEEEARRRLAGLDAMLAVVPIPGSREPVAVTVSVGVAAFAVVADLEKALEAADERMYRRKLGRRSPTGAGPP